MPATLSPRRCTCSAAPERYIRSSGRLKRRWRPIRQKKIYRHFVEIQAQFRDVQTPEALIDGFGVSSGRATRSF